MKKTLVLPVLNDATRLPALFAALNRLLKKDPLELIFVDGNSSDESPALLREFCLKQKLAKVVREERPGYAHAYDRGLTEAKGELILLLDAETIPEADWSLAMEAALEHDSIAVGLTETALPPKGSPFGKVMAGLFKGRSQRSAFGQGHALPWGAACNLGVQREWFQKLGSFSPAAGSAYDMDWCWRAVLNGATIGYAPKAKVTKHRPADKESVLHHFESYGLGEAWMHRTYHFLLGDGAEGSDPLMVANGAYLRLRRYSPLAAQASLAEPLEEVAMAFASGMRLGYDRPLTACPLKRTLPKQAIGWFTGKKALTIFVPGKGVTTLEGKPAELFLAWRGGAGQEELEELFRKLFKASTHEAQHEVEEFLAALEPQAGPANWVPVH